MAIALAMAFAISFAVLVIVAIPIAVAVATKELMTAPVQLLIIEFIYKMQHSGIMPHIGRNIGFLMFVRPILSWKDFLTFI